MYFGCMYSMFCMLGVFWMYVWQAWYMYVYVWQAGCPPRKCVYLAKSAATGLRDWSNPFEAHSCKNNTFDKYDFVWENLFLKYTKSVEIRY